MSVKVTVIKSRPATQASAGLVLPPQASDCLSSLRTVFARPLDVAPVPPRSNPQTTDPADVNNRGLPVEVPLRTTGQAVLHKFVQATQLSLRDYARLLHMAVTLACSEPSIVFLAQATDSFASRNKETLDGVISAARAMHLRSCAMLRDCLARATSGKDPQAFSMCLDLIVEARLSVLAFLPLLERLAPANQAELFGPWKTAQGRDAFAGCISFGQTPSPLGPTWLTPRQLAYVVNKGRRCRQVVSFAFGHLDTAWQDMDALIGQQSNALQAARSWSNVCQPQALNSVENSLALVTWVLIDEDNKMPHKNKSLSKSDEGFLSTGLYDCFTRAMQVLRGAVDDILLLPDDDAKEATGPCLHSDFFTRVSYIISQARMGLLLAASKEFEADRPRQSRIASSLAQSAMNAATEIAMAIDFKLVCQRTGCKDAVLQSIAQAGSVQQPVTPCLPMFQEREAISFVVAKSCETQVSNKRKTPPRSSDNINNEGVATLKFPRVDICESQES